MRARKISGKFGVVQWCFSGNSTGLPTQIGYRNGSAQLLAKRICVGLERGRMRPFTFDMAPHKLVIEAGSFRQLIQTPSALSSECVDVAEAGSFVTLLRSILRRPGAHGGW
jgi:hypothetical protein